MTAPKPKSVGVLMVGSKAIPNLPDLLNDVDLGALSEYTGLEGDELHRWARRYIVAKLHIQKVPRKEIAERIGVCEGTVKSDIGLLRKGWKTEFDAESKTIRAEMAQSLDTDEAVIREAMMLALGDFRPEMVDAKVAAGKKVSVPRLELALRHFDRLAKVYELRLQVFGVSDAPPPAYADNRTYVQNNFEAFVPGALPAGELKRPTFPDVPPQKGIPDGTQGQNGG